MFEDAQKEVILEEAHSSVWNLQVRAGDGLDESLEQFLNVRLKFRDVTDIQNLK